MEVSKRLATCAASVHAKLPPTPCAPALGTIEAFVLQWFEQMRTGNIDRTQLAPEYSAHLTDHAVEHMSRFLREYEFGASPLGAHVMRKHEMGDQTFYLTKVLFPRGDAASLLFGFNSAGKVTGVSLMSMAGD